MTDRPNPFSAAFSMLKARGVAHPNPRGANGVGHDIDHQALASVLSAAASDGITSLPSHSTTLTAYLDGLATVDPDNLSSAEALAYWINAYNAAALRLAGTAATGGASSVLRVPGAFTAPVLTVVGHDLSLDQIEHGKIRRFKDPRIHGALVCGAVSCPTLRAEPYTGANLDTQLDNQMQQFLTNGGASLDRATNVLTMSRVFKWYGRDFVKPAKMPSLLPSRASEIRRAVAGWMASDDRAYVLASEPTVQYADYDWGLGCSIA